MQAKQVKMKVLVDALYVFANFKQIRKAIVAKETKKPFKVSEKQATHIVAINLEGEIHVNPSAIYGANRALFEKHVEAWFDAGKTLNHSSFPNSEGGEPMMMVDINFLKANMKNTRAKDVYNVVDEAHKEFIKALN